MCNADFATLVVNVFFCAAAHRAKLTGSLSAAELGNTHALHALGTQFQQLFLDLCWDALSLLLLSMSAIACLGILVVLLIHSNFDAGLNSTVGTCAPASGGHSHDCHLHTKGMATLHPVRPV